jgi:hypothetical protein
LTIEDHTLGVIYLNSNLNKVILGQYLIQKYLKNDLVAVFSYDGKNDTTWFHVIYNPSLSLEQRDMIRLYYKACPIGEGCIVEKKGFHNSL